MCLALIAIGQHPRYPIIILSNRDEFYNRATVPAHYWPDHPTMFSGKDLLAGGTWLGVNKKGNFSLLTNYRTPAADHVLKKSRGLLVKNFLENNNVSPLDYINNIAGSSAEYSSFNLIVGNLHEVIYYSNVINKTTRMRTGVHCLSNHLLNTRWHKTLKAKNLFHSLLGELLTYDDPVIIRDLLAPVLEDQTLAADNRLPQTGVSFALEKSLSSIFVTIPEANYGTRSSTITLIEKTNIFFSEKVFINGKAVSLQATNIAVHK